MGIKASRLLLGKVYDAPFFSGNGGFEMKWVAILVSLVIFLVSGNLLCDDKDKAKEHFLKGKTLFETHTCLL